MTGADPNSGWLKGCVALDAKGFVKTGPDLDHAVGEGAACIQLVHRALAE
jgi:hypothetical protein